MRDRDSFDLAVIGAGPAGMSAAATAADQGLRVALIDAGRQLGGQYFRHPAPGLTAPWLPNLHHGWQRFEDLVTRVETATGIEVLFDHQVWAVEPGFRVLTDRGPIAAPFVLLATGAHERVVPFPGWDLPGVVTAGGAQALLKGNLVLPGRQVVVAGTGPLLLPVAAALATAGARVLGLYEANAVRGYAKNPIPLLTNPAKVTEGLDYARQFARARVPVHTHRMVIEAEGTDALEAVVVARPDGGKPERVECDTLAISYGLTPQIDLALTLGAEPTQLSDGTTALRVNTTQRTTVPGLYAAGETAGVAGAETALVEGEIAALAIARAFHTRNLPPPAATAEKPAGRRVTRALTAARSRFSRSADAATGTPVVTSPLPPPPNLATLLRSRARQRAFAELLRARHPIPALWHTHLSAETLVCRCEEVPVAAITEAVTELGATDARTVKLLTRAGMGWCQGRMCGYAIACLARTDPAEGDAVSAPAEADLLAAAKRPLARPVPLSVLADRDKRNK